MYKIVYTKKAVSDIPKLKAAHLDARAKALIDVLRENPLQADPRYEKLRGSFDGAYSRRINLKHRMVYQIVESEKTVKILSMWSHYEF
jgi:Txe/YoeB family toxin of toxin-antitoxin system